LEDQTRNDCPLLRVVDSIVRVRREEPASDEEDS